MTVDETPKGHSYYLAIAIEAAHLFPDPSREIGPAGLHWFAGVLRDAGAGPGERLDCYLAVRMVLFGTRHGDLNRWFEEVTVAEVIDTLTKAACEMVRCGE